MRTLLCHDQGISDGTPELDNSYRSLWPVVALKQMTAFATGLIISLGLICYVPLASGTLYHEDSVGFALAIHDYNLKLHQPGAPGYPLYVLALRIVQLLTSVSSDSTLVILNIVATIVSALMIYKLVKSLTSSLGALLLSLLLLTSPVVWFNAEISMSYPVGMLAGLTVAFMALKMNQGNTTARYLAPICWGLAAGFRQELAVILAPLVIYCARHQFLRSKRYLIIFFVLAGSAAAPWLLFLVNHLGGVRAYIDYVRNTASSVSAWSSLRRGDFTQGIELAVQNGSVWAIFALLGSLGVLPLQALRFTRTAFSRSTELIRVFALWALPGVGLHILTTVGHSGYILSYLPAMLLLATLPLLRKNVQFENLGSKLTMGHALVIVGIILQSAFFLVWPQTTGILSGSWIQDTLLRTAGTEPTRSRVAHDDNTVKYLISEIELKYPADKTFLIVPVGDELPRYRTIRPMFSQARYYLPSWEQRVLYTTPLEVFKRLSMPDVMTAEVNNSKFNLVTTNVIQIPRNVEWLVWFCDETTLPYGFDDSWTRYAVHPGVNLVVANIRSDSQVRHWGPFEFRPETSNGF